VPLPLDPSILDAAVARLAGTFDWANGSWGGAPKFPQPMTLEFLPRRVVGPDDAVPHVAAEGDQDLDPTRALYWRGITLGAAGEGQSRGASLATVATGCTATSGGATRSTSRLSKSATSPGSKRRPRCRSNSSHTRSGGHASL
jgi:hypothetical protein